MTANKREKPTERIENGVLTNQAVQGFELAVVTGLDRGTSFRSTSESCTIGFHPSCDLELRDTSVSRFHCHLTSDAKRVRIRDLGSSNGTIVDGLHINDGYIKHDCFVHIGRTTIHFRLLHERALLALSEYSRFGLLRGESPTMRRMFALLERAAPTDATILLVGETGTGKTAAARSIHDQSGRKTGPFITIDCSSLPSNLLESELFGHEKGAFTGAFGLRVGAFEEADGGTIFLDELGELPVELQAKLLTVLESREIRRVGSNRARPVDVRIIAATNRDLRQEVNVGRFRTDLYYRLSVVVIEIPPLRARLDDLPVVVDSLLARLDLPAEQRETIATPELLRELRGSSWPGNIRELRNHLERYLLFQDLDGLDLGNLEQSAQRGDASEDLSSAVHVDAEQPFADARKRVLGEFERLYVTDLLRKHDSNVSRAASHAGITRTYLYRLAQRHKIRGPKTQE